MRDSQTLLSILAIDEGELQGERFLGL